METIKLCTAKERWTGCRIKKNLCCVFCEYLDECLYKFEQDKKNKIRPCEPGFEKNCEFLSEV